MVWIESITTRAGISLAGKPSMVATMSSTEVAAVSTTPLSERPVRDARMRSWSVASSPET